MIDIPAELLPYVRVSERRVAIPMNTTARVADANPQRWLLWIVALSTSAEVRLAWSGVGSDRGFRLQTNQELQLWAGRHGSLPTFEWVGTPTGFGIGDLWVVEVILQPRRGRRK